MTCHKNRLARFSDGCKIIRTFSGGETTVLGSKDDHNRAENDEVGSDEERRRDDDRDGSAKHNKVKLRNVSYTKAR